MSALAAVAAEIELRFCQRTLYLLVATAEEEAAQREKAQRTLLVNFIATRITGLRVGKFQTVPCDVAKDWPALQWPASHVGIPVKTGKAERTYNVSVGNVAVTVERVS